MKTKEITSNNVLNIIKAAFRVGDHKVVNSFSIASWTFSWLLPNHQIDDTSDNPPIQTSIVLPTLPIENHRVMLALPCWIHSIPIEHTEKTTWFWVSWTGPGHWVKHFLSNIIVHHEKNISYRSESGNGQKYLPFQGSSSHLIGSSRWLSLTYRYPIIYDKCGRYSYSLSTHWG